MVSSDFLKRVTAYPVVTAAFERATAGLSWAKDRSACARAAAGIAESGLRRVAVGAAPLVRRYEDRIAGLDRLACRQLLDRLETACPTVLQTEKVVERGRSYYSDAVKPKVELVLSPVSAVVAKVQSAKSVGLERYRQALGSRYGQSGLRQFDQLIRLLGDCLDKCLPPGAEEKAAGGAGERGADGAAAGEAGSAAEARRQEEEERDLARSLALVVELGRRVSGRVSDRVVDGAGRVTSAGHKLVDRLLRRPGTVSHSASLPSTVSAVSASSASSGPAADKAAAAESDGEVEESMLDRSDMSTD